jgi:fused signal recognition particle receptor
MRNTSWFGKLTAALKKSANAISDGLAGVFSSHSAQKLSAEQIEEIQDILIQSDVSFRVASVICEGLRGKRVADVNEAKAILASSVAEILRPHTIPFCEYLLRGLEDSPALGGREVGPGGAAGTGEAIGVKGAGREVGTGGAEAIGAAGPAQTCAIVVIGVNGSGKTTTIAKLSKMLVEKHLSVEWAACDTFRAAAVEQMQVWADRLGICLYKTEFSQSAHSAASSVQAAAASANLASAAPASAAVASAAATPSRQNTGIAAPPQKKQDPSALAFQACQKAKEKGTRVLFVDTAGRLQNNAQLMQELAKIVRTVQKVCEVSRYVLVLDGVIGQNAISQVEMFGKIAPITDLIVTKLDGMAKAGFIIELCQKFKLNISAIGVGEGAEDIGDLDPDVFAKALVGLEEA